MHWNSTSGQLCIEGLRIFSDFIFHIFPIFYIGLHFLIQEREQYINSSLKRKKKKKNSLLPPKTSTQVT